jgi:hypothetical protein
MMLASAADMARLAASVIFGSIDLAASERG